MAKLVTTATEAGTGAGTELLTDLLANKRWLTANFGDRKPSLDYNMPIPYSTNTLSSFFSMYVLLTFCQAEKKTVVHEWNKEGRFFRPQLAAIAPPVCLPLSHY